MVRVLFVCMGNICRSPLAEGAFAHLVAAAGLGAEIATDSAGTGSWHVGQSPDERAVAAAARRGIDIAGQRARQLSSADFAGFDYVLAMDHTNLEAFGSIAPARHGATVALFLSYANGLAADEVPDPYYGGDDGFEHVLNLVEAGAAGLLKHIRRELS